MSEKHDNPAEAGTGADATASEDFTTQIDAIAGILDDPETDTEEDEAHAEDDAEGEGADEVADDIDAKSEEDSDDKAEDGKQDEPQATGGRFVEHNARVHLPNGETTTVHELLQGYNRQSDYTRKSQENADIRRSLEGDRTRVGETAQQLQDQLARLSTMLDQWRPQPPDIPYEEDPIAWGKYEHQVRAWGDWQKTIENETQQFRTGQESESQKALADTMTREHGKLVEKFPAMADEAKRHAFFEEAVKTFGTKYGFSQEELGSIVDHRLLLVIRDVMRADRLNAKAAVVKDKIEKKPKMVRGGRRGSDPNQDAKRARIERLRETGRRDDGVRSLMDLDL